MTAPDIGAVLVCDDIRKEVSNKDILIGVYGGDIVVKAFPTWLNVAVWLEVLPKEVGKQDLIFRLSIAGQSVEMRGEMQANDLAPIGAGLPGLQMLAERETEITVEIKEGDDWRVLKRKKVRQGVVRLPGAEISLRTSP